MKVKKKPDSTTPTIFGTGLLALDLVVQSGQIVQITAGGTCGNVLLALAYMGWKTSPIGRLAMDEPGKLIESEFIAWGADTSRLHCPPTVATPVIVERLSRDSGGHSFHSFSFHCPSCGERLPMYRPITLPAAASVSEDLKAGQVLFIDRVSPSSVALAEAASQAGLIIYFEPSSISDVRLFRKLLALCHIVKYSQDRIDDLGESKFPGNILLEIQTLGSGGLRFRSRLGQSATRWHSLAAPKVETVVDTTGAGDWFSAGLIHAACRRGLIALRSLSSCELLNCLSVAQGLAAWTCRYVGARGGMYQINRAEFTEVLRSLQAASIRPILSDARVELGSYLNGKSICLRCTPENSINELRSAVPAFHRLM